MHSRYVQASQLMKQILQIPSWLLFILLVIVPATFSSDEVGNYIKVFYGILVTFWIIKVDEELYLRIKGKATINFNLLMVGLVFALLYFSSVIILTDGYSIKTGKDNFAEYGWLLYIYVPGHLIAFAAYLYGLHFAAYSIHVLDDQLFGKRTDYITLLAALFFFPIGVWWTQPKINRILKEPVR